jgi:hypothetical protein
MRLRRQLRRRAAAVLRTESRLVPPTDAAPSPEVVARPRNLIDLATPLAIRVAASLRLGEQLEAGGHGRTFWEDLDSELPRRFLDGLMLVQGSRTSPQIAEPHDWRAVIDVVGGSGGLPAEQGLALLEHACAAR